MLCYSMLYHNTLTLYYAILWYYKRARSMRTCENSEASSCSYIYIYIYIYVHITYIYIYIHTSHTYVYIYIYTHITYIYIYIYAHHVYYKHMCLCIYIYIYTLYCELTYKLIATNKCMLLIEIHIICPTK